MLLSVLSTTLFSLILLLTVFNPFLRTNYIHGGGALDLHEGVGTRLHINLPMQIDHLDSGSYKSIEPTITDTIRTYYSSILKRHNGSSFSLDPTYGMFCFANEVRARFADAAYLHTPRERIQDDTISKLPVFPMDLSIYQYPPKEEGHALATYKQQETTAVSETFVISTTIKFTFLTSSCLCVKQDDN